MLLHEVMLSLAETNKDKIALVDRYNNFTCTYNELVKYIKQFSMGLRQTGIKQGEHIAQFSENSPRWFIADQGLIAAGCANAIRGSQAPFAELEYIYNHSDSVALITDSKKVLKYWADNKDKLTTKTIIYIGASELDKSEYALNCPLYSFDDILEKGKDITYEPVNISEDDVFTLIYSSGTTGAPKGVMLTHKNMTSQIENIGKTLRLEHNKNCLSVLPIWHAYERTCGYYLVSIGSKVFYTTPKNFKNDLKNNKIEYLVAVPRLWEAVYKAIMSQIESRPFVQKRILLSLIDNARNWAKGKRFLQNNYIFNETPNIFEKSWVGLQVALRTPLFKLTDKLIFTKLKKLVGFDTLKILVSGGGALLPPIAEFYEALGAALLVGYGMTETAPIISVSRQNNNKIYSAGEPLEGTEILIVDPETMAPMKQGEKGLVLAKGPQIMKGYYKDPENTQKVLLPNGYINTGDLGWVCRDGSLVLVGRQKDIIVLSNGENIEAEAIEAACLDFDGIDQIVLTGQDKNSLSALVVPNVEKIKQLYNIPSVDLNGLNSNKDIKLKILKELQDKIKKRPNYRVFERLSNINFISECTVDNGMMTQTLKIKKNIVCEKYKDKIEKMYTN